MNSVPSVKNEIELVSLEPKVYDQLNISVNDQSINNAHNSINTKVYRKNKIKIKLPDVSTKQMSLKLKQQGQTTVKKQLSDYKSFLDAIQVSEPSDGTPKQSVFLNDYQRSPKDFKEFHRKDNRKDSVPLSTHASPHQPFSSLG